MPRNFYQPFLAVVFKMKSSGCFWPVLQIFKKSSSAFFVFSTASSFFKNQKLLLFFPAKFLK